MNNQINPTNKAILFLLPPYDIKSDKIRLDTNISYKESKLTLIEIIQAKDYCDNEALVKLVLLVVKHPNKSITIIINKDILCIPINSSLWFALSTLLAKKLITIATYEREYGNIRELTGYRVQLLEFYTAYFKKYFVLDWQKTLEQDKTNMGNILIKLTNTPPSFKKITKSFVVKLKQYLINFKTKRQNQEDLEKLIQEIKHKLAVLQQMSGNTE